ncbi:MAG: hypothetical protein E7266_09435 [Lachnospiraceae bacterium]|nr:hypothetical protein [Lachnospiraceae bacterium]
MKKLTSLFLTLVCVVVMFVGCSMESKYQSTNVENVNISISDVSSTGATVIITDSNKEPYIYGEWYSIEKEKDGKWYEVKTIINNYGFKDIGYIPNANGKIELTVDWEWLYGKLSPGTYRLLKKVNSQYISVEFSIE